MFWRWSLYSSLHHVKPAVLGVEMKERCVTQLLHSKLYAEININNTSFARIKLNHEINSGYHRRTHGDSTTGISVCLVTVQRSCSRV
jgi:hypothetical protein